MRAIVQGNSDTLHRLQAPKAKGDDALVVFMDTNVDLIEVQALCIDEASNAVVTCARSVLDKVSAATRKQLVCSPVRS
jgi:hypothetical protein